MSTHKTRIRLLTAALLCAVALAPATQGVGLPALPPLPQLPPECRLDLVASFGDEQSAGIGPLCQTIRDGDIGIGGGGGVPEECRFDLTADLQPFDLPRMPQQTVGIGEFCQAVKDTDIPGPGDVPEECSVATAALQQPAGLPRMPQQSADIGEVCQAVKDTEKPETPPPAGYECSRRKDDNGFGGTHVDCKYACRTGDELAIYVEAHDTSWGTAEADGSTECGDAKADCDTHPSENVCTGVSVEPAINNEREALCEGESHEAIDDPVTVACYAMGMTTICKTFPQLPGCNPGLGLAMHDCLAARPDIMGDERAAGLLSMIPSEAVSSFVAFTFTSTEGFAIGSSLLESGEATCWGGPFALN